MNSKLTLCLNIDGNSIYKFSGIMNEKNMINSANTIEKLLIDQSAPKDKVQNVFELFVETIQNILNYASNSIELSNNKREVECDCSLSFFTKDNSYILESCNLIHKDQKALIEERIASINGLDKQTLRKLIRKSSRSKEKKHHYGAGLGYILMSLKSIEPIKIEFNEYNNSTFRYKQKLVI